MAVALLSEVDAADVASFSMSLSSFRIYAREEKSGAFPNQGLFLSLSLAAVAALAFSDADIAQRTRDPVECLQAKRKKGGPSKPGTCSGGDCS